MEHLEFLADMVEGAGKEVKILQPVAMLREIVEQLMPLAEEKTPEDR